MFMPFLRPFFRIYQGNMDGSQIVDFTKIIVSVIPQQSVRLNITKKSFGDASIKFQPMFEDHCKSARIEYYRYPLPSVKANTAERIVKTANSFISWTYWVSSDSNLGLPRYLSTDGAAAGCINKEHLTFNCKNSV